MNRQIIIAFTVAAMIAVIVGMDFLFFRDRFWERLMANIGVVLVFGALSLRFLRVLRIRAPNSSDALLTGTLTHSNCDAIQIVAHTPHPPLSEGRFSNTHRETA